MISPVLPWSYWPWRLRLRWPSYWLGYTNDGATLIGRAGARLSEELARAMPSYEVARYLEVKGRRLLQQADHVVVAGHEHDGCIALLTARWRSGATLQLSAALVAEAHQRTLLLPRMLGLLVAHLGPLPPRAVALTTAHPSSYRCMQAFEPIDGVELYPRLDGPQSVQSRMRARVLAHEVAPGHRFDPDTGVITGGAGPVPADFYHHRPRCSRARIDEYFAEHLGPSDRLLCRLSIRDMATWQRVTERLVLTVPRLHPPSPRPRLGA